MLTHSEFEAFAKHKAMFVNSAALVLSIFDTFHFFCIFRDCCGALHSPSPRFASQMILLAAKVTKDGKNKGTSLVWLRRPPPPGRFVILA